MNYKQIDDMYVAHTYARFPLCITKGEGCYCYDEKDNKYLDFTSGIGVNSLGFCYPKWVKAVQNQTATLTHISNLYYSTPMLEVAEKLCKLSSMKRVFFANSGAEANEGAVKVARKYGNLKYEGKRYEIITLVNSFHGRTITTLSATGQDVFHKDFNPFTRGFVYCKANDIQSVKEAINEKTLAIMIEIVQGEGGVIALDKDFLSNLQTLCNEKDILLIIDEVQSGIARTGKFFAYEHYDLKPDLVTSAKGLGNGLPIGAVLMNEKVKDVLQYGDHGTTFGGNPIVCSGANVVLDEMTPTFLKEIEEKGNYIKKKLQAMPHIKKVNGLGLMIGVELDTIDSKELVNACLKKGVLFLTAKKNLRMLPPLIITIEEIDKGLAILNDVLTNWEI